MLERFKTIYKPAETEIFEKKSRFIGHAFPVCNEEAAMAHLAAVRKAHPKANHNCFAWQMGSANEKTRQSDDGEPSGTAGMPILDYLRKEDIRDALLVVTRYFGGTLLGTGGLVRAYGRAAKEAAVAAQIIEKVLHRQILLSCPYTLSGKIEYEVLQRRDMCVVINTEYTEQVTFEIYAEETQAQRLVKHLTDISAAGADIVLGEKAYCARIDGGFVRF